MDPHKNLIGGRRVPARDGRLLEDKNPADRRETVMATLRKRFALLKLDSLSVDRIALFRQNDADTSFRIVDHWKLRQV